MPSGVPKIKHIDYKNFLNLAKHKIVVKFLPEYNQNTTQIQFLSTCSSSVLSQVQLWGSFCSDHHEVGGIALVRA